MKNQRLFSGIILLGIGIFFLAQQLNFLTTYITWPTLLIIVGVAFLVEAYGEKNAEAIFPGVILTGLGLHFHLVNVLSIWPNMSSAFVLFISLGFILRYQKTGNGLISGLLFLSLAVIMLFHKQILNLAGLSLARFEAITKLWPLALILIGCYLLFFRKRS